MKNIAKKPQIMTENLTKIVSDATKVAEKAAIACYDWIGKGDEKAADQAAVTAMRDELNSMNISGTIVIGEGERDEAPMLYIGEEVGDFEYKINSHIYMLIGKNQLKMFTRGEYAWFKRKIEDKNTIQMMLNSSDIKVRSDSAIGTYAIDEYSSKGLPRAYLRMKQLCQ